MAEQLIGGRFDMRRGVFMGGRGGQLYGTVMRVGILRQGVCDLV